MNKQYYGIIYKVTNKINNKIYIGQTVNKLIYRKKGHVKSTEKGSTTYFHCAIRRYGIEMFSWKIIDKVNSKEELNNKEQYWIKKYKSNIKEFGYNLTSGGKQNGKYNDEVKQKISIKLTGKKASEEAKLNISKGLKGRKITWKGKISKSNIGKHFADENTKIKMSKGQLERYKNKPKEKASKKTKKLMSKSQKERFKANPIVYSEERKLATSIRTKKMWETRERRKSDSEKLKISKGVKKYYNKNPMSDETREKHRLGRLGKTNSLETREKLRQINLGKHPSEATKNKISETKKRQWLEKKLKTV
jgi:group I intron endonuclease